MSWLLYWSGFSMAAAKLLWLIQTIHAHEKSNRLSCDDKCFWEPIMNPTYLLDCLSRHWLITQWEMNPIIRSQYVPVSWGSSSHLLLSSVVQGSLYLWDIVKGEVLRDIILGDLDYSIFVRQLHIIGNSAAVCDYGNKICVIHFPAVLEKVEWRQQCTLCSHHHHHHHHKICHSTLFLITIPLLPYKKVTLVFLKLRVGGFVLQNGEWMLSSASAASEWTLKPCDLGSISSCLTGGHFPWWSDLGLCESAVVNYQQVLMFLMLKILMTFVCFTEIFSVSILCFSVATLSRECNLFVSSMYDVADCPQDGWWIFMKCSITWYFTYAACELLMEQSVFLNDACCLTVFICSSATFITINLIQDRRVQSIHSR